VATPALTQKDKALKNQAQRLALKMGLTKSSIQDRLNEMRYQSQELMDKKRNQRRNNAATANPGRREELGRYRLNKRLMGPSPAIGTRSPGDYASFDRGIMPGTISDENSFGRVTTRQNL